MRASHSALAVGLLALAVAAGSVPGLARTDPPAALIEAARKEGKVVWYAQPGTRSLLKGPLATWTRRWPGVAVEIVEAPGPEVTERLKSERRAKRHVADVVSSGDNGAFDMQAAGIFQNYDAASLPNLGLLLARLRPIVAAQSHFVPTTIYTYGIVVNTKALPEAEWPKSFRDVASPRYKDKVAIHDYSRPGGGASFATHARKAYGDDFLRQIASIAPRVYGRVQELDAAVVRGERAIALPGRTRVPADNPGAPVKFILPEDGIYATIINSGIVDGAPRRNAAHLLMNFLLERDVQQIYADLGDGPVISGIPASVDFENVKLFDIGHFKAEDMVRYRETLAVAKSVFSR